MQHHLPIEALGPDGPAMAGAVSACVHCGFCLAACPTYRVLGEEMDSPRGRIVLMKQALEGELPVDDAMPYIDRCLGCLACETACPSGVRYRDLVVPFRARAEPRSRSAARAAWRRLLLNILESPRLFRKAVAAGRIARPIAGLLPPRLRATLSLVPAGLPPRDAPPEVTPAAGVRRARVALIEGCVQQVLRPSINHATRRLLSANGVEVVTPRAQGCCGALALHAGLADRAHRLASRMATEVPRDVEAIVVTAAGCGSAMKDMEAMPAAVHDVAEFLDMLGLRTPLRLERRTTIAYQDACHLAHGQGVRAAPRRLLASIANVALVEIRDGESCCGSAGLYNLEHPDTARALGGQKAAAIRETGADLVATGNIGCLTQLEMHLADGSPAIPVRHTIEVLESACRDPV